MMKSMIIAVSSILTTFGITSLGYSQNQYNPLELTVVAYTANNIPELPDYDYSVPPQDNGAVIVYNYNVFPDPQLLDRLRQLREWRWEVRLANASTHPKLVSYAKSREAVYVIYRVNGVRNVRVLSTAEALNWEYKLQPTLKSVIAEQQRPVVRQTIPVQYYSIPMSGGSCPGGNCPTSRW